MSYLTREDIENARTYIRETLKDLPMSPDSLAKLWDNSYLDNEQAIVAVNDEVKEVLRESTDLIELISYSSGYSLGLLTGIKSLELKEE